MKLKRGIESGHLKAKNEPKQAKNSAQKKREEIKKNPRRGKNGHEHKMGTAHRFQLKNI